MKSTKRIFSFLLALVMLFGMLPLVTVSARATEQSAEEKVTAEEVIWGEGVGGQREAMLANITNSSQDPSKYTKSEKMITALKNIFSGHANIYRDARCTKELLVPLGSYSVPDNGVQLYTSNGYNSGTSCWIYAVGVYYTLFGSDTRWQNSDSISALNGLTQVSYSSFKSAGVRQNVGAHIRTSTHSMIVLNYDESKIYILHGNWGNGLVCISEFTWSEFNSSVLNPNGVKKPISFIVQPTDSHYNSLYPQNDMVKKSYDSHVKFKITAAAANVKTLPCSESSSSESKTVEPATKGSTYTAIKLVENKFGNLWYYVKAKNGQMGYIYSGDVGSVEQIINDEDVTLSNLSEPGQITEGSSFGLTDKISTKYQKLSRVYAGIKKNLDGTTVQKKEVATDTTSYKFSGSTIDNNIKFETLDIGEYTYYFGATFKCYYAKSTKEVGTKEMTGLLYSQKFSVVSKPITYTVSYNANGGSGAPASQTKTHGQTLTLSSTKPTRSGYTFLGWSTSSTATSATYAAGGTYTVNASATLYAVWKSSSESSESSGTSVSIGTVVEGALQLLYYNEGSYGSINKNDNGAVSIGKIQWHGNRALNLLKTIVKMDQSAAESILGTTLYNEIKTSTDWSSRTVTSAEATALSTLLTTSNGKKAQDDLATTDVTVYINNGRNLGIKDAAALIYFADLENQGGYGMSSRVAASAAKTAGSYGAITLDVLHKAALADSVAGNYKTRREKAYNYCKDYVVGYVITFQPNGGTCATSSVSVEAGKSIGTLPTPTRSGYTFDGWYTSSTGGTKVTASTTFTDNTTLYAHWTAEHTHSYTAEVFGATCNDPGYTVYTCVCGDTYKETNTGNWSEWSTTKPSGVNETLIESRTEYRSRTKSYKTSSNSSLDEWTLYDTGSQWSDYGSWSNWSTTKATASDTTKVETRTAYGYYYYLCSKCGAHMHGYGTCWTWAGGCGASTNNSGWRSLYSPVSWDSANLKDWHGTGKYYTYLDGQLYFKWSEGGSVTQYRYCTRTLENVYYYYQWSDWSDWNTNAVTATSDKEVQTRTTYRYANVELGDHKYESVVTAPTCTKEGYTTYTCSVCKDSYVDNYTPIAEHSWNSGTVTNASTCTATGVKTYTCTACSVTKTEAIPATGHTEAVDKAVAATCTTTGLTEGKHCSVCGEVLVAQKVAAALGHTEVIDKAVAATCTTTGLTEGKHCFACNEVLVAQKVVAALGHTEVIDKAVSATCTTTGLTEGKHCSVCDEILVAQKTVAATGHTWDNGVITKEATEETEGEKLYTCVSCAETKTQVIPTLDHVHNYTSVVTAPTCTEAGFTTYTCRCGDSYVADYVDALGHTEVIDKAVAATCTATGLTEGKHCAVCNEVLVAQKVVAALGHTEVIDKAVAATCTTTGLTEGKHCDLCNEVLVAQKVVAALGHTEVIDEAVAATCTKTGLTEGKHCDLCNEILVAQKVVAALGHTEVIDKAVAATCTATGLTEGKHCSVCNEILVAQETVDALGHDIIDGICNRCEEYSLAIVKQPEDVGVKPGEKAVVTVEAAGKGLSYTWYYKNPGAGSFIRTTAFTGPTYSLTMTEARNGRQVYCLVKDEYGNQVKTDVVTLSIHKAELQIVAQPESVEVRSGETAEVTVEAVGDGLTYTWYYKNKGASKFKKSETITGPIYFVTMSASRSGRQIYCLIKDEYGNKVKTDVVTLNVFKTDLQIVKQPESVVVNSGEIAEVTVEAVGDGLTYTWYYKNKGASKYKVSETITGPTYFVTMSASRSGRQLYCLIKDEYGNQIKTDVVTLTMYTTPLTIVSQSGDMTVDEGETAVVTVEATGDDLTYEWYYKNAGASSYKKTNTFAGNYYTLEMNLSRSGRRVYCKITDAYGNTIESNPVLLTMESTPLEIVRQPESVTVANGKTCEVYVEATGDGLKYEWYYKNATSSKFTKANTFKDVSYSVKMNSKRTGRQVYCKITDAYGNKVTTDIVTLNMESELKLLSQPKDVVAANGETVEIAVGVEGNGLKYAWYYRNAGKSEFTKTNTFKSDYYILEMNSARDGREVYCVITDAYGNVVATDIVTFTMEK